MNRSVAIIIPCYNAAPFLRETLDSTLRQTRPPEEVILVDDGSTDDSAGIAASYGPPIRVIRQTNQGESVAMNAALAAAQSEYIVFLGADDVLHPQLLERQLRGLEGVKNGVACTGFAFFLDDIQKPLRIIMPHAKTFFPDIILGNLAPASCWMTPRELILQAGCYNSTQQYFEDWDLWWRVGLAGATYVPIDFVGFYYRQHVRSQLATAGNADRAYGHAWLMERMCRAIIERHDLLSAYGGTLFWAACAALRACLAFGVSWDRLYFLSTMLDEIARRRPAGLDNSSFARAVRLLGFRRAQTLERLWSRRVDAPSYRASWLTTPSPKAEGVGSS
jgi:glycosyltransferase involved in cell wall biosynthesis